MDSAGRQAYSKLRISPYGTPSAYSGSIITADSIVIKEPGQSCSVALAPATYSVRAMGRNCESDFLCYFPSSLDGTTASAAEYIVTQISDCNFTASYALTAGSASYAVTSSYALNAAGGWPSESFFPGNWYGNLPTASCPSPMGVAVDTSTGDISWFYNNAWH